MAMPKPKILRQHAQASVRDAAYSVHRLVFYHTVLLLALNALTNLADFLLSGSIEGTGGLGGLGLRSMLSTAQTVLQLVTLLALPFVQAGMVCAAISIAHRQEFGPRTLLGGFREFSRVLRYRVLETLIYLVSAIACITVANQVFMMLPFSRKFFTLLEGLTQSTQVTDTLLAEFSAAYAPALVIFGVLFGVLAVFFHYQYRMGLYLLLLRPNITATGALRGSWNRMKGNKLAMFKLDLSYWWYYLLDALCSAVVYLDLFLELLGVEIPLDDTTRFLVTMTVYTLCQLALYTWMRGTVETTYVHAYDAIIGSSQYPEE